MTTPVPPEAITAAASAIYDLLAKPDTLPIDRAQAANRFALAAVEAAADVLRAEGAAAGRDRCIKLAVEVGAVYAAEMPDGETDENVPFDTLLRGEP